MHARCPIQLSNSPILSSPVLTGRPKPQEFAVTPSSGFHPSSATASWNTGSPVKPGDDSCSGDWLSKPEDTHPHSRGRSCPRFALAPVPSTKRAQGKPGARCTRGLVCKFVQKKRTRAYRSSGGIPAFPAQWFTAYFALSSVTGLFATVALRNLPPKLDASTGASGPHDFTVRISYARQSQLSRPPHLTARS